MPQNSEAQAFIDRVLALPKGPGVSLESVLQPSLDDEAALRRLFATEKDNNRLKNPYVGLVNVFDAPPDIRTIRARIVKDEEDLNGKYVMPLSPKDRKAEGTACMVPSLEEFQKNWAVFSEGSLSQLLDWNNVVAAGGSVLACLVPLPEEAKVSKRAIRKYYHGSAYPSSDIDLFLWGLTPQQVRFFMLQRYRQLSRFSQGRSQDRHDIRGGKGLRSVGCDLRTNQAHCLHSLSVSFLVIVIHAI